MYISTTHIFISFEKHPILAWLLKLDYTVMFFSTKKGDT